MKNKKHVQPSTPQSTSHVSEAESSAGAGRAMPVIEIVVDDDVGTPRRHRPAPPSCQPSPALSSSSSSHADTTPHRGDVPPEVKKLWVNKDTGETIMHKAARLGKEVRATLHVAHLLDNPIIQKHLIPSIHTSLIHPFTHPSFLHHGPQFPHGIY